MDRRRFIKLLAAGVAASTLSGGELAALEAAAGGLASGSLPVQDSDVKDYMTKMKNFDRYNKGDILVTGDEKTLMRSSLVRLKRLQRTVGHGNFSLLSFDLALRTARNFPSVGAFTSQELAFLEKVFYEKADSYGFMGDKPVKNLTSTISRGSVVKIPGTGNYLYKGAPYETYRKICREVGAEVILTSGVRSVVKQFMLFLNKATSSGDNISLASRSLAPPGYSFHAVGDFDLGKVGLGRANFTEKFTGTSVYKKLLSLGYADLRYEKNNTLGVRFEPWHVKVGAAHS